MKKQNKWFEKVQKVLKSVDALFPIQGDGIDVNIVSD